MVVARRDREMLWPFCEVLLVTPVYAEDILTLIIGSELDCLTPCAEQSLTKLASL